MLNLKGKYGEAIIYGTIIDNSTIEQINKLLDQPFTKDCKIRIMEDNHAGAGCCIGFTANLGDKVVPNLVGVDIGCGILTVPLGNVEIDFKKLDKIIKEKIPSGFNIHKQKVAKFDKIQELYCYRDLKILER